MAWRCNEPGHQQPWYRASSSRMFYDVHSEYKWGELFWSIIYSTVLWANIQHHYTTLSNLKMGHRKRKLLAWFSHNTQVAAACGQKRQSYMIFCSVMVNNTPILHADAIIHNQDLCTHNLHLTIELRFHLVNMISTHHNISRNRKAVVSRTLRFLYTDAIWTGSDPVPMPKKIITWSNST